MSTRLALSARRNHIAQKVKISGQRTLYISIHDNKHPADIFLRAKGADCSSDLIGLYDVIARLMSLTLLYGFFESRRWAISSLQPSVFHVAPSSGTIASSIIRACHRVKFCPYPIPSIETFRTPESCYP
jgi:hypothetical protein